MPVANQPRLDGLGQFGFQVSMSIPSVGRRWPIPGHSQVSSHTQAPLAGMLCEVTVFLAILGLVVVFLAAFAFFFRREAITSSLIIVYLVMATKITIILVSQSFFRGVQWLIQFTSRRC